MGYNVADIIEKALKIAVRRRAIYESIGQHKSDILYVKIFSNVLIKQMDKTVKYYESLLNEIRKVTFEEIDFSTYDKMSSLISNFNMRLNEINITSGREFLEFSLSLERAVYSLLVDIQGRFVKNTDDVHTRTYEILSDIILSKAKQIEMIERML
ncbi:hypothetical protein Desaci_2649 [Desulfosporosinus acidiphilus SJ4]|uniref:PhoU domain-containing protein n=1 Tax=Desulfosporosinus acidiphilus (strain DSM 22704 / JCM 16185 / SJ4) TaxID=646529 RepID=I4D708_DESAJ|nr:hypothetical protein [Desulfosporosinus acidiphilus]AFM41582.1 hypothetical protein Desaci_2649 [Desulfosporosinus acidiphilus SJ4]